MNAHRLIASLAIFAVVVGGIGVTIWSAHGEQNTPGHLATSAPPAASPPQMPLPGKSSRSAVVVTDRNCTGPTRCVYKYRIEPKYIGMHPLPEKEIKVVYQVTGGHQPQVGDFTVQGGEARVLEDVALDGRPGARLQALVTQIVG